MYAAWSKSTEVAGRLARSPLKPNVNCSTFALVPRSAGKEAVYELDQQDARAGIPPAVKGIVWESLRPASILEVPPLPLPDRPRHRRPHYHATRGRRRTERRHRSGGRIQRLLRLRSAQQCGVNAAQSIRRARLLGRRTGSRTARRRFHPGQCRLAVANQAGPSSNAHKSSVTRTPECTVFLNLRATKSIVKERG